MNDNPLINTLPDECLMHIFSFLPLCDKLDVEKVCKRWRRISERGWPSSKDIDLRLIIPKDKLYCIFKRCGRFLTIVKIPMGREYHNCIPLIMKFCRLDRLELIIIEHIGFEIGSGNLYYAEINKDLIALFEKTTNLIAVKIMGDVITTHMDYLNVLPSQTLEGIVIDNNNEWLCGHFSIDIHRYPKLNYLLCTNVAVNGTPEEVNDPMDLVELSLLNYGRKNLIKKIQFFTKLVKLNLGDSCEIDNEDICNILKNCQNLRLLQLDCSIHMTSITFQLLGKIPFLKNLSLGYLSDHDAVQYLTNVRFLLLTNCCAVGKYNGLLQLIANSSTLERVAILDVDMMSETFMEELGNIFKNGQRKRSLRMTIGIFTAWGFHYEYEGSPHPLLVFDIIYQTRDRCVRGIEY